MLARQSNSCYKKLTGQRFGRKPVHKIPAPMPGYKLMTHKPAHKPGYGLMRIFTSKLPALLIPAAIILFIFLLMIFSKAALVSAAKSVELWLGTIIPSLFPFMVASEILSGTGFV